MDRDISKVLIVDNDVESLRFMEDILGKEGIRVLTAKDGKEAIDRLRADTPDVLITGLIVPKISGEQLIEYVRADSGLRHIFVMVLSGAIQEYTGLDKLKADYFLEKGDTETTRNSLFEIVKRLKKSKGRPLKTEIPVTNFQPRKVVRELLTDRRQKRQVTACIKEGIIIYDFDHKVLEANSAAEKYLGKASNALLNSFVDEAFDNVHQGAIKAILEKISGGEKEDAHLIISIGERILDFHFSAFERERKDVVSGGMILIYDLTRQKLAEKRLAKRVKELGVLNQIAQLLNSSLVEDVIFSALIEKLVALLSAEAGTIALFENNDIYGTDLIFKYTCGEMIEGMMDVRTRKDYGLVGWTISNNEAVIIDDTDKDARFFPDIDDKTGFKTRSVLCAPIRADKRIIGVIEILNKKEGRFNHRDLTLLNTILDMAALSLNNSFSHEKIIAQRDYYSGIMSSLKEGIIILNSDLSIMELNQFFLIFLDKKRSDIIGRKCHSVLFNRDDPCTDCDFKLSEAFKMGKDFSCNRVLHDGEGRPHDFGVSGTALEVKDEEVTSFLLTFTDISRIVRLNAYLDASSVIASLLLKGGSIADLVKDVLMIMGRAAGASRCYWFENHEDVSGALFMIQRAEWCMEGIAPRMETPGLKNRAYDDFPRWYEELSRGRVISGAVAVFPAEERAALEPRGIKCILIIPMFRREDLVGFIGFDNCVSETPWQDAEVNLLRSTTDSIAMAFEHQKSLDELKESNVRYNDIIENLSDFWYLHDMEGRIVEVNPAAERVTGYDRQELLSMNVRDIIPRLYRHKFDDYLKELRLRERAEGIIRLRFKDGGEGIFEYRNWMIELSNGEKVSRGIVREVTERIKLEAQLRRAQKMESMGAIATGVSHNFRNILAGIMVNSQLIQLKHQNDPQLQKYAGEITRLSETGSVLISALLQFSRKDSQGPKSVINLADVLDDTYHMISQSFDKKVVTRTAWPEILPIYGDRSSLSQVFMNLCTNARDAMPSGGILRMAAKVEAKRVSVIISDTGCGMDNDTMEKVFDPFFTTKAPDKGTGLGLSTAYGIVKEHKGEIQVESEPDHGTSFKIHFPLADPVAQNETKIASEVVRGNGEKVLVVDDEETLLPPLEELLEGLGYRVKAVESGVKAIEEYNIWRPNVVLLDRNMPGMDGLSVSRTILAKDPDAKIILMSGYEARGTDGIDDRIKQAIKGYVIKPFDIEVLSRVLADVMKKANAWKRDE